MQLDRIGITGGAGFLGSHLCEHLLDNFCTGTLVNLEHLFEGGPFRLVHADVTN